MTASTRGRLLVAAPSLTDDNFDRGVLLVLEHNDDGAIGVVLNRPSELPVSGAIEDWAHLASAPARVFVGGPVSPSSVIALAEAGPDDAGAHFTPVLGPIGTVDLEQPPSSLPGVTRIRVFAGYAGWAPGQLEAELGSSAWFVVDAVPGDVFGDDPTELWWRVLDRQPGDLGRLRHFPRETWHN